MAEQNSAEKSEKASPQKLRKAREQGQVPRARDLAAALGLILALKLIFWMAPDWVEQFRHLFQLAYAPLNGYDTLENAGSKLFYSSLMLLVQMILPLAIVPALMFLVSLYPGGWIFVLSLLSPKLSRFNPLGHVGRVVSVKQASEIGKSILKAILLGIVLYMIARQAQQDFFKLHGVPMLMALTQSADILLTCLLKLAAVFLLFALIDLPLQVFLFLRQQKMSKQDIKEEHKSNEGRPEIKQRMRQIQRQMAQRGVRKAVPDANVIIVNPEHYAVALKYDEKIAQAPFIVAKGVDEMALYIRQIGMENNIAVVPLAPLARAIYHTTQVNQQIPAPLYRAVAQVLTYILQLNAFHAGARHHLPELPADVPVPSEMANPELTT